MSCSPYNPPLRVLECACKGAVHLAFAFTIHTTPSLFIENN